MKKALALKIICACIMLIMLGADLKAQQTRPYMWVDRQKSIERKNSYRLKHDLMSQYSGIDQTDSIYYPDFFAMTDFFTNTYAANYYYLRAYIAVYPPEGAANPKVPLGWGGKLTLIFVPVGEDFKDIPNAYYTIPPDENFNSSTGHLSITEKDAWISLYTTGLLPQIKKTIPDVPENRDGGTAAGELSDTKSVLYLKTNIDELKAETGPGRRRVHRRAGSRATLDVTGVKAFFAAFTGKGNENKNKIYKNRLHIEFEFTDKDGYVIYLDDDTKDQFPLGKGHKYPDQDIYGLTTFGLNNGQLCPANCP